MDLFYPPTQLVLLLILILQILGTSFSLNFNLPDIHFHKFHFNLPDIHIHKFPFIKKKHHDYLNIQSTFKFPASSPIWPPGEGFASGTIDLGGLITSEVTTFNKIWTTYEGGPENKGATFFEPIGLPNGFSILGHYAQPNNRALFGRVVVAKDNVGGASPTLKRPKDYALVWSSETLNVKADTNGYIWAPIPFDGYQAVGLIVTNSPDKPSLDKVMCVRSDLTSSCVIDELVWGRQGGVDSKVINVFESRPSSTGVQATAVSTGTFIARTGTGTTIDMPNLVCLNNNLKTSTYMPNLEQIKTIINSYAPRIYNHPNEQFLPSSVEWFFSNGALLYKKGEESNPVKIDPMGSNLPQGGANDGLYWIDLPRDKGARDKVAKGNIASANAYFHVKRVFGGTYTDVAIWLFYPFNGGSTAKVGIVNVPLGKIGEHVGDWEHVTLRVSNFNGVLTKVFFSQHASGEWVRAPNLEYLNDNTNRFIGYASLHGHAAYAHSGDVVQGTELVGLRNDTAKSNNFLDTTKGYNIISADYIEGVVEPPWLNYARKWGPMIDYNVDDEVHKVAKILPGKLKTDFMNFVKNLPPELLGEEGPIGPKMKRSWDGEEIVK